MNHVAGTEEFRKYPRTVLSQSAKLLVQGSAPSVCRTLDVSSGGISAMVSENIDIGSCCLLSMETRIDSRLRKINIWGKIVYCAAEGDAYRVGIQYREYDSMSKSCLLQLCA
jgi:c-di-GMP-binding flagellar brake protein YcgR